MNNFTKNTKSCNLPLGTLALVATVLLPASAYADVSDQIYNLKAESDVEIDYFGNSLAMESGVVSVAAFGNNPDGSISVSAYRYDLSTGLPLPNLSPSDGETQYHLGATIATDIGVVALAAWNDPDIGVGSGYVYILDTATGNQIARLYPNDGTDDDLFGFSLAIDNGVVAVGAYLHDNNGEDTGAVYLFDVSTGNQIGKLVPSDDTSLAYFGYSLAIDNGIVVIGAHGDDNDTGAVYLFDLSTGNQIAKLHPSDGAAGDHFGWSVAINNDMVGVGSPGHDDSRKPDVGAVYLYDVSTGNQIAKLHPSDGAADDHFGWSLAINNDMVGVGSPGHDDGDRPDTGTGAAYYYDLSTGNQIAQLLPNANATDNHFGTAIAIDDSYTAIGASGGDYDYGPGSGSVYVFQLADEAPACPWDLDNSGSVDTSDLLELFAQWDTADKADFDENGSVNTIDMILLFANWGSCP